MIKTISKQRRALSRNYYSLRIPEIKMNTCLNFGNQGHSYVIERFGKYNRTKQSGIFFTIPYLETIKTVDMRQLVLDVDKLSSFTGDNVSVHVEARLYFTVKNSEDVCYKVAQVIDALVAQAQSALRTAIGKNDLDHLLKDRNSINKSVCEDLETAGEQWGIDVHRFEITNFQPDSHIQRAMDLQSTAERERRAKIIEAEGIKRSKELIAEGDKSSVELNALAKKNAMILEAEGMLNSAKNLDQVPKHVLEYWMQLRHVQMVGDVAKEGNHSTYFVNRDLTALPTLSAYEDMEKTQK